MAKAELRFTIPIPPYTAFSTLGAAMAHCGIHPFAQDGWSLRGKETYGLFSMGWPVTVTATVAPDPGGGSVIDLQGTNFGWGFNTVHVRQKLEHVEFSMKHAAQGMVFPPAPTPPPAAAGDSAPADEEGLPPRLL